MRATVGFSAPYTTTTTTTTTTASPPSSTHYSVASYSAWHSPVPYLFGGLAAMLGLIAFALLILACSYWKLSGYLDAGEDAGDAESGAGADGTKAAAAVAKPPACFERRIVVIMAGDENPTFLAMPISSRASSLDDHGGSSADGNSSNGASNGDGEVEGKKVESGEGVELNGNESLRQEDDQSGENDQTSQSQEQ